MAGLSNLPTEMIRNICDQLVPDMIVTGTRLPLPNEHRLRQRALRNLTLVSHYIGDIATEFLYRTLVIQSTTQMVCFFRTICDKPDLRRHTFFIANFVPLMDSTLQGKIEADIERHFPTLPATVTGPSYIYPPELFQLTPDIYFRTNHCGRTRSFGTSVSYTINQFPSRSGQYKEQSLFKQAHSALFYF